MSAEHGPAAPPPNASAGTARFIARGLLAASHERRYAALAPAENRPLLARLLDEAGECWFVRATASRFFRVVFLRVVDGILPGILAHYLARKRCLEAWTLRALGADGPGSAACRQVVVLGAGLDNLAWRLHRRFPAVRFLELDHPAALQVKERAMAGDSSRSSNLTFLPVDLAAATLPAVLARCPAFDPAARTLFLAEGLLMYLPVARVWSLLREVAALAAAGEPHSFAFTFMEARADGRIGFRRSSPLVNGWLRRRGEPFRSSHPPDGLAALLSGAGLALSELVSGDDLRARFLAPAGLAAAPLAMGEWLALARTGRAG